MNRSSEQFKNRNICCTYEREIEVGNPCPALWFTVSWVNVMCCQQVPARIKIPLPAVTFSKLSRNNSTEPEKPDRLGVDIPVLLVQGHLKVGETETHQEVLATELRAEFCP